MVLTEGGRLSSLSSQYTGFRDFDEPVRVVTPVSSCDADGEKRLFSPFGSAEQQRGDTSTSGNQCAGGGSILQESGIVPFRSLSLGAYAWASYTPFEVLETDDESPANDSSQLERDTGTDLLGKVINSSGSMVILQTKYETTLKSLGLIDSEDEERPAEDPDFLFSRWGFHNGRPSCAPAALEISAEGIKQSTTALKAKTGNKQQGKRWRILSANARKLPSTLTGRCQCMPWSWRRIRSWGRRRRGYDSVLGSSDDDEIIGVSPPQRSYTDGHSVVICDTLSFTDLRQRKRFHRPCFSWGGSGDGPPAEDEIGLLNDAENSDGKKFD